MSPPFSASAHLPPRVSVAVMAHAPAAPTTDWPAAVILLDDTLRRLGQRLTAAEADLRLARHNYEALVDASLRSVGQLPCAARLTSQELRVANLVAAGMSNREVADALQVSVHTVKTHVKNVLAKLSLRSRWQIAAMVGQPTVDVGAMTLGARGRADRLHELAPLANDPV